MVQQKGKECNHNLVLSSFIACHQVCNKSYTTYTTCGAETVHPSGAPARSLVFDPMFVL